IINHAAQCAIQCRQASPEYTAAGERLAKLQAAYRGLTEAIFQGGMRDIQTTKRILEDLQVILYDGCIATMLGKYHLVNVGNTVDQEATAAHTDQLFGIEAKAIAQAAAKLWEQRIMERPSKVLTPPIGTDLGYKFDPQRQEDSVILSHTLTHVTVLLLEALKAHYRHLAQARL
ncbi:MAG: hypothetical protein AAFP93_01840, partial [Bacteroidota bacterium]